MKQCARQQRALSVPISFHSRISNSNMTDSEEAVARVLYWPHSAQQLSKGLLIGWEIDSSTFDRLHTFIVACVLNPKQAKEAKQRLSNLKQQICVCEEISPDSQLIFEAKTRQICFQDLKILANWRAKYSNLDSWDTDNVSGVPVVAGTKWDTIIEYDDRLSLYELPRSIFPFNDDLGHYYSRNLVRLSHSGTVGRICGDKHSNQKTLNEYFSASEVHTCPKCCKLLIPSVYWQRDRIVKQWNAYSQTALHCLYGGFLFYTLSSSFPVLLNGYAKHYSFVHETLAWLEQFPIGFKLNVRLTNSMGVELRRLMELHEGAFRRMAAFCGKARLLQLHYPLALLGACLGAKRAMSVIKFVWNGAWLHLNFLSCAFKALFKSETYLLSALWRLFRGKKHNILRQRTDTMKYDSTQLLLGTTLFTIVLFMFTTVLVYSFFFVCLETLCDSAVKMLSRALQFVCNLKMGEMILIQIQPSWFCKTPFVEEVPSGWYRLRVSR